MAEPKCAGCGNKPLKDIICSTCGEYAMADVDEGTVEIGPGGKIITSPGTDFETQLVCKCGSKQFKDVWQNYCSLCKHQQSKDD